MKEVLVPGAKVIQPILSCCGLRKAMLGTLAIAGESYVALLAIGRKSRSLGSAETSLLLRCNQRSHGALHDVAEPVLGINKVVALVEIAIVFNRERPPALGSEDTQRLRHAIPRLECDIEDLYEDAAHVLNDPAVEDLLQKSSELQRLH